MTKKDKVRVKHADTASEEVTIERMTVTPDVAYDWLVANLNNRSLREHYVKQLAGALQRGEWKFNGDAIRFGKDGVLQDGQHRLMAIIEANMPMDTMVIKGLEPQAQETMDTGTKRRLADVLKLRGVSGGAELSAILSYVQRWKDGTLRLTGGNVRATTAQLVVLFESDPDGFQEAMSMARSITSMFKYPSPGLVGALYYIFKTIDAEDAEAFWRKVGTGAGLEEGSPILALRRQIERAHANTGSLETRRLAAVTIKAWNAWRNGEQLKNLSWRSGGAKAENFPEPV